MFKILQVQIKRNQEYVTTKGWKEESLLPVFKFSVSLICLLMMSQVQGIKNRTPLSPLVIWSCHASPKLHNSLGLHL